MTQADKDREEFDNIFGFTDNLWKDWINPNDNFRIPTHHAPITNQLERVWLINNAEPPNNLVTNTGAGGTTYKVTDTPKINLEDYENLYFKLFMKDNKSPFRAYETVENKLSEEEISKTASVLNKVSSDSHLLGGYYVVLNPFSSCVEANKFFKEHCKTALFIKRESKCDSCNYRQGNVCSLMSKHLASDIKYDDKLVNASIKKAYAETRITKESAIKLLRITDSKKRMQSYLKHLASKEKLNDGNEKQLPMYRQENIMRQDNIIKDDIKVASLAIEKLIVNGSSRDNIISKVGKYIGTSTVNQLIPEVLSKVKGPINTYKFAECDDSLRGQIHLLKKDAACGDCIFNSNKFCSKYKVSFIQESKDPVILSLGEKIKEARTKNKDYMENFFVKCVDSGVNYGQIKQAFEINIGKEELSNLLSGSLKKAKKLDPFNFSKCEGSFYNSVDKIYMGKNCHGCVHNAGVSCSKIKKAFVNPVQVKSMYANDIPLVTNKDTNSEVTLNKYASVARNEYTKGGNLATVSRKLGSMGLNTSQISSALVDFISLSPSVNSVQLNGCRDSELIKHANKLDKTETCKMCTMNQEIKCAKFNKEFRTSDSIPSAYAGDSIEVNEDPLYQLGDFNISF